MDRPKSKRQHAVIGGKTILGKIFAYQEKTGMSIKDIMEIPYIMFVLGMADAPAIDYDSKKEEEEATVPKDANTEALTLSKYLI